MFRKPNIFKIKFCAETYMHLHLPLKTSW